ncbi:polyphenol oxidase, chloroplastic-like [Corylus avellana]|uniref:polyphenol oxidase, chloroplastic-like n=1 Tax=Corylus avellana TaxID=13451 RepID=UPI00286B3571|nr:polyphenol oxidase, chloroplastic-like [Corylus avellana]
MASLSTTPSCTTTNTFPSFSFCYVFPKKPQISKARKRNHYPVPRVACKATKGDQNLSSGSKDGQAPPHPRGKFDRRDVLIGLGGLYGTASLYNDPVALASPVSTDITKCGLANVEDPHDCRPQSPPSKIDCCPPIPLSTEIKDFKLPSTDPMRVRRAAHLVDQDYIAKFNEAIKRMKALPPDDPCNFEQQANVHCAYCDGAYHQFGFPDHELQIHSSWLFFPFHRYLLYFYEKILGKLIGDPTFALPFWNWDHPDGMQMPAMFQNGQLRDRYRNRNHLPPTLIDFDYSSRVEEIGTAPTPDPRKIISRNLKIMHRQMVSGAKTAELFHGYPYRAGDNPEPGAGTVEHVPHNNTHLWCGDPTRPYWEDMGNFYSAGKDPIFYAHHSNVDRMWDIWKTLEGGTRKDFTDSDWLNSNFIFYDENRQPVRVYVRDCLDSNNLRYKYQPVEIPWKEPPNKPTRRRSNPVRVANAIQTPASVLFPFVLGKDRNVISTVVARPRPIRSGSEGEKEEVLVIEGIEFEKDAAVKFDVYINDDEYSLSGPENTEFAGSFVHVPHLHAHEKKKTSLKFGITDLLRELEAGDKVLVTLVPREGKGLVTIGGIKIELLS